MVQIDVGQAFQPDIFRPRGPPGKADLRQTVLLPPTVVGQFAAEAERGQSDPGDPGDAGDPGGGRSAARRNDSAPRCASASGIVAVKRDG